ncbi:MFS transporter [Streptomyces sp. NPDC094034]|uniref:MFS transporter n=1 Tax=Streptomyces sp. NPDC094034 TaxID=3155309 RepID=UPI003322ECB2
MGDLYGKRRMLLAALILLTVGCLVDAVTDSLPVLIFGRACQGAAMAVIPLGISLLAALLPAQRAGWAVAVVSALLGVGSSLGLPLGGLVAESWEWQSLMWISFALGLVSFTSIVLLVRESHQPIVGRVDPVGGLLLVAGLLALVLPLEQAHEWGWGSLRVWGCLPLPQCCCSSWLRTR